MTLLFGVVRPDGRLTYCNAGHNPPFVIGASNIRRLESGGPVLGLLESASYDQEDVVLSPGDVVLVFSDGVAEALNVADEEFGEERLADVIATTGTSSAHALVDAVVAAVRGFSNGATQSDDITVMAIRYLGRPS